MDYAHARSLTNFKILSSTSTCTATDIQRDSTVCKWFFLLPSTEYQHSTFAYNGYSSCIMELLVFCLLFSSTLKMKYLRKTAKFSLVSTFFFVGT